MSVKIALQCKNADPWKRRWLLVVDLWQKDSLNESGYSMSGRQLPIRIVTRRAKNIYLLIMQNPHHPVASFFPRLRVGILSAVLFELTVSGADCAVVARGSATGGGAECTAWILQHRKA